jgi:hypothetical protein
MPLRHCPVCHSRVPLEAKKCRHCHHYLGFSLQWAWTEGVRVLGLVAMVAAALVAWKSLEFTLVAEKEKEEALTQAAIYHQEHDALREDLQTGSSSPAMLQGQASLNMQRLMTKASDATTDVRVRQVLSDAWDLERQHVRFSMGGKSPEEGFDASGFVSYLLAKAGALDPLYQRTFSVAKLEKSFPAIGADKAKPGDLVFLDAGFVAIHLGGDMALGMGGAKGIQIFSFAKGAKKSYHRWAYGQEARMLR